MNIHVHPGFLIRKAFKGHMVERYLKSEKIKYLFWGVITTLVYFLVRFVAMALLHQAMLPVLLAQVVTVLFAFVVNKFFVFADNQSRHVVVQLMRFSAGRLFVAGIDFLLTYIMIERYSDIFIRLLRLNIINFQTFPFGLSWSWLDGWVYDSKSLNAVLAVFLIQVIAIVVNYFISKFMIFD
ncbi:GtrA family protein [Leuconostoc gelidum]|uniref:GtrA family protein n=2 Tax=Leuconostoc gelidum TaxID=1244 RepID=UPI001CC6684F|nr:GtrA family protein [Leuconostoc gelidum]